MQQPSVRYKKNVACLETNFWFDNNHNLDAHSALSVLSDFHDISITHRKCNYMRDLTRNLKEIGKANKYQILYLAFHGQPGYITLNDGKMVRLQRLAELMERHFSNTIVIFGACSTFNTKQAVLKAFKKTTDVDLIIGYRKPMHWITGIATDLIVLDQLQSSRLTDPQTFHKKLITHFPDLIKKTGLTVI